ncbi:DUF6703 family protein [Flexivirga oryzae]|uniref:Asparagine N-glycosylation enzyme membrane subunit Stt3 n=1 Tax=Flexivirga oryzae TaxID=1794944 RepID=A0A839N4Z7_9MICO|nr:DUF6703 family protein [Flexivirga oryzae]MBB2891093.1 asparagine N-glycosylation enzyme membrane subunit Stt3 [Flexivirga oryzae]
MSAPSRPSVRTSPLRVRVEHASDPMLQRIARAPRAVPALVVLALLVIGVVFRGVVGTVCFGICALLVAWLLYLAWPRIQPIERMMRCSVLLLAVALAIVSTGM